MPTREDTAGTATGNRPYWWPDGEVCPPANDCHHEDEDHPEERLHRSDWCAEFDLTLPEPTATWYENRYHFDPVRLLVHVVQHVREREPRVVFEPEFLKDGRRYDLTPGEAEELGQALLYGARLTRLWQARGHDGHAQGNPEDTLARLADGVDAAESTWGAALDRIEGQLAVLRGGNE